MSMNRASFLWAIGTALLAIVAFITEERQGLLGIGAKAPDFTATLSNGERISLSDFLGKKNVVLFFYPKDFTAACTAQACSMRDEHVEFARLDAVVFGVSADDVKAHTLFRSEHELPFELIADVDRTIIRRFGVERLGGLLKLTKRVTYVIDKNGIIRHVAHHEFFVGNHSKDVLTSLKSLSSTDR